MLSEDTMSLGTVALATVQRVHVLFPDDILWPSSAFCFRTLAPLYLPEGPSTQYLRSLVPKTILLMVFGTRVLKYWVLGPSGSDILLLGPALIGWKRSINRQAWMTFAICCPARKAHQQARDTSFELLHAKST